MKNIGIFIIIIAFLFIGASCSSVPERPPEISMTINEQEIKYIMAPSWGYTTIPSWENENSYPETFQVIFDEGIEIPYIDIEGTINIEFNSNPPIEVNLKDFLIYYENGLEISRNQVNNTQLNLKNKKVSFDFSPNADNELYMGNDYEHDIIYRGFELICKWKSNSTDELRMCVYAFVIKTNE